MSNYNDRGGSSRGSGGYRDREHGRDRSRSPRRDGERARLRYDDPPPRGSRDDRYSESRSHDHRSSSSRGGYNDPDRPIDRESPAVREPPSAPRGPRGLTGERDPPPHQRQPYNGAPQGPRGGYNGGGREPDYGRGGGGQNYDRPLDRRAIEEGRRQREAERAEQRTRELIEKRDREEAELAAKEMKDIKGKSSQSALKKAASRSYASTPDPDRKPSTSELGSGSPYQREDGEDEEEMEEDDPEADAMAQMLGFGGFGTTKNQKRVGADGAASVNKQRTWRQYMNRRGGFNRPLDALKE